VQLRKELAELRAERDEKPGNRRTTA
jgi:hypothetical protein